VTNLPKTRVNKQVHQTIHYLLSPYLTRFVAQLPRYVRVNTCLGSLDEALKSFISRGFSHGNPFLSKYVSEMVKLTFSQSSLEEHVSRRMNTSQICYCSPLIFLSSVIHYTFLERSSYKIKPPVFRHLSSRRRPVTAL